VGKVKLSKISSQAFEHEADRKAIEALRKTVGFDRLIRALGSITHDKVFEVIGKSNHVRVGPKQIPSLHKLFLEVCDTLDVEPPPLYVEQKSEINAGSAGVEKPVILVTSALLDAMTDKEIQAVLGHEIGHWMAGHVLYRMVAEHIRAFLVVVGEMTLGVGKLLSLGIVPSLMYWYRCAELTADRAGLLAVQDLDVVLATEMKLAGGSSGLGRFAKELDIDAFMEQARQATMDDDTWTNIYRAILEVERTHPWPVVRAREIEKWVKSGEYDRILGGEFQKRASAAVASGPHPKKDEAVAAAAAEIAIGAALARAYGVHVAPRIPEHPLHLALGSFVEPLGADERVVAFYDDTFSGTGDKGVILTNERIFASNAPKKGLRFATIVKLEDLPSGLLSRPGIQVEDLELRFHTRDVRDAFKAAIVAAVEAHKPA
jgi:Zn-dependent protease with chaperone function